MLTLFLAALVAVPSPPDSADSARYSEVWKALRSYTQAFDASLDSTAVQIAWIDVSGDGSDDAIVYLTDDDWCGSGGCTVLVFEAMDDIDAEEMGAYRPAAEISLMHGPVRVAPARKGAWRDLIVEDENGVARQLSFNGETYPYSPGEGRAVQGAVPAGTTLFADAR